MFKHWYLTRILFKFKYNFQYISSQHVLVISKNKNLCCVATNLWRLYFKGDTLLFRSFSQRHCDQLQQRLVFHVRIIFFVLQTEMEELSAVGEQVFDAECILNKRLKKVRERKNSFEAIFVYQTFHLLLIAVFIFKGKLEFLVKWRGWSSK